MPSSVCNKRLGGTAACSQISPYQAGNKYIHLRAESMLIRSVTLTEDIFKSGVYLADQLKTPPNNQTSPFDTEDFTRWEFSNLLCLVNWLSAPRVTLFSTPGLLFSAVVCPFHEFQQLAFRASSALLYTAYLHTSNQCRGRTIRAN